MIISVQYFLGIKSRNIKEEEKCDGLYAVASSVNDAKIDIGIGAD